MVGDLNELRAAHAADSKDPKDRELRMWCLTVTGGDVYRAERAYMWVTGGHALVTRAEYYDDADVSSGIQGSDAQ